MSGEAERTSVFILGLGLIGGSLALALTASGHYRVVGCDRDAETLRKALAAGALAGEGTEEALAQAAQWGTRPTGIEKKVHRTHIFTHVQWELTGFYLDCAAQAPQFFWADARELEENLGFPTAYRQFLEEPLASRRKNGYTEATKE